MSRSTAAMSYSQDDDRPAQYTFSADHTDDDDDESSVEDVFAFLPPSTADAPAHEYPPLEYPAPVYNPATPVRVSLPSTVEKSNVRAESFAATGSEEGSIKMEFDFDAIEEEDSPFPEVRASVSNIDDPDMPALTIRMWFVGLFLCTISSSLNVFFNFRSPAPSVVPLALLLIAYPFGKFLAFVLPITTYRFRSFEFSLNPGPWNIKEHVLVFIMANVAVGNPYALNAIVVSEFFYDIKIGYWFALVLVLATQLTGFGLAGICRRFLVWPASMVWPQNLVACTLLNTLHAEDDESSGGMTRYRYFMLVTTGSFFWFFLPGFLFEALSVFSFVCWAAPNNIPVNQVFGVSSGLGMSVITFDWTEISWIGSPLMVPWWAEVHVFLGFVLFFWILTPALYYSNAWKLAYFPISANIPYDRFGNEYNITRVLTLGDTFNATAYAEYSPLYLPATYAMTYLLAFALSTCVIVHTLLYHGRSLLNGIKKMRVESDDIHAKLMRNYPEVPDWWYLLSFRWRCVVPGCHFLVPSADLALPPQVWHTGVPVWALLLAVALPIIYILPSGFIYAMTGQEITLNILAQIIPGSLLPGNPLANMIFKSYSVQTLTEATSFIQDLKLGHYVKVPPRASFLVQLVGTLVAAFLQVGVKTWIFSNVEDICSDNQKSQLTCPHNQVFFTASIIWGLIGPSRQFGLNSIYHPHVYALVIGAVLPLPFWFWQRRYPNSWIKYISTPVILNGVSGIPPATGINYSAWFAKRFAWWSKFNYVTSAALDSGTVISLMVIFFTLQFPKNGKITVNWWGNSVYKQTADYNRIPWKKVPAGGIPLR
ncbi:OPT oligopeptide transporter [Mycena capillaripes]|nr:OPT oligopeptide transporter [Mycena capillaripes]